ncbi:MAG: hypothetical protein KY475_03170 [Planctomycetes bacterium]|nr:hypothetical protein [Planctomycetota bacterium]
MDYYRECLRSALLGILVACGGCGGSSERRAEAPQPQAAVGAKPASEPPAVSESESQAPKKSEADAPKREWRRSLADLLQQTDEESRAEGEAPFAAPPLPDIDESRLAAAGIRKLEGTHLTLYTDLPPQPAIDELPQVFDLAVPQWSAYFGVDPEDTEDWRLRGYLMERKEPFAATGLLPGDLPPFLHGFNRGHEVWLYEQPSDYYRRHLLLHEGVHGFMKSHLGDAGPPWYMEGMAELLGTHRWEDGMLTLGWFPQTREEAPMWGRVKIVQDDFAANRGLSLGKVFEMGPQAHLELAPYGWSWAAAAFFDGHSRTREAFRSLKEHVHRDEPEFSARLRESLAAEWPKVMEEWQLFVANIDYGYDLARAAVVYGPGSPLPPEGTTITLAADRGWQSSGVEVEEGRSYTISASGRYTVAQTPQPWWCEPNGVTIRYHDGLPLGMLLGTVRAEGFTDGSVSAFLNPGAIGLGRTIRAPATGVLYFRINDSPAELADNGGALTIHIH